MNSLDIDIFEKEIKKFPENTHFIFYFSHLIFRSEKEFETLFEKISISQANTYSARMNPGILSLYGRSSSLRYIESLGSSSRFDIDLILPSSIELAPIESLVDLSNFNQFINFFTSSFKTRNFNDIDVRDTIITKSSKDKRKILSEYKFYYLLPEYMQRWFVQPFDYIEMEESSSYRLEKINFPDLSLLWVCGAFGLDDFDKSLQQIFNFVEHRAKKDADKEIVKSITQKLFKEKVLERVSLFKKKTMYTKINSIVSSLTSFDSFDDIVDAYLKLYEKNIEKLDVSSLVVGHGDLCFSNILYDKKTEYLRLIDPKGATIEDELWTHPYYDLAKLSHSILGLYDFINKGLFEISLDYQNKAVLKFHHHDLHSHRLLFIKKCEDLGYDPFFIRLFESSLFLSMIPLHLEDEKKVLGFVLTATVIIEELNENE